MRNIVHIPHSSTVIPSEFLPDYVITPELLQVEANIMCDKGTDLLVDLDDNVVIFPYSRIFCDVERYNSYLEEMNSVGMGILYENSHDLIHIRKVKNPELILKYYHEHHSKLNILTKKILDESGEVLIIDLHSYSDIPLKYELHKGLKRPDICIGINNFHMDDKLKYEILYIIDKFGFSYEINQPFIGSLIPSDFINDSRVKGVMIEIKKSIMEAEFQKIREVIKCIKKI